MSLEFGLNDLIVVEIYKFNIKISKWKKSIKLITPGTKKRKYKNYYVAIFLFSKVLGHNFNPIVILGLDSKSMTIERLGHLLQLLMKCGSHRSLV